jgi:hypothetical protein
MFEEVTATLLAAVEQSNPGCRVPRLAAYHWIAWNSGSLEANFWSLTVYDNQTIDSP